MTKTTRTLIGAKARKAALDGVNAIYQAVRHTLGPQAKKALLYRTFNRGPRIVDDGYMVAEVQEPRDMFVRLAAQTFKEACKRTNEKVGDATTTTAVVGGRLMNDVYAKLSDGQTDFTARTSGKVGVMTMRRRILESAQRAKDAIRAAAVKVTTLEDMEKIATVSVDDPELGKVIAKMAWETGVDGFIDVVEGYKGEVETEVIKGFRFMAKVPAKAFVNNPARFEMVMQDCPVLVTNYALDNAGEVSHVFQRLNDREGGTSKLIVVAPSFSDNVLVNMVSATQQGFFIHPVLAPSLRTEQFDDLATYCGASFVDKQKGRKLSAVQFSDLGFLEKLIVKDTESREEAVATGGRGATSVSEGPDGFATPMSKRLEILKGQLAETKEENFKKLLERRIASMASAVGIVRVGDSTQASSLYRKLKIEDAVYACKAALRGGYVKGGGLCLKEIADSMDDSDILKAALRAPYDQMQSSVDGGLEIGPEIIDPAEAMWYAVEHATGVVANLATVEIMTAEAEEMLPGEGESAIARALNEFVLNDKISKGIISSNQAEAERDRLNGLTTDDIQVLDNG